MRSESSFADPYQEQGKVTGLQVLTANEIDDCQRVFFRDETRHDRKAVEMGLFAVHTEHRFV